MNRLSSPLLSIESPVLVGSIAALAGILVGLGVALGAENTEVGLTVAMALVAPVPVVIRAVQGKLDPFEPIMVLALAIFVLFVVRPTAELLTVPGEFVSFDTDPRPGYSGAMVIALVGAAGLYAGYFMGTGRKIAHSVRALPDSWDVAKSMRYTIGLLIFTALMTAVFAAAIGGPGALFNFYLGRTATDFNQAVATAAYFTLAPYMTIPAALIVLIGVLRERTPARVALLVALLAVIAFITVPRGDRTYTMAIVMPLLILPFLKRDRRPRLMGVVAVVALAIVALNIMVGLRQVTHRAEKGVGATIVESVTNPTKELEKFILGVDIAEFTVMEMQYMATSQGRLPYHPGATAGSLIAGPLPGKIIGEKPKPGAVHATDFLFPDNKRNAIFTNSLFGDLYADWGLATVLFYTFIFGIGLRFLWEYFLRNRHSEGMQVVFAASLPLLIALMRDNFSLTFGRAVFLLLPLIICLFACAKGRSGPAEPAGTPVAG